MNHWSEYPFVRILFAFLAGLLLCLFTTIHFPGWLVVILLFCTIAVHILARNKTVRLYRFAALVGCSFQISAFVTGNVLTWYQIDYNDPRQFAHVIDSADYFVVKITEPPVEKERSYKVIVSVVAFYDPGTITTSFGKSILYLQKDNLAQNLQYGNVLLVKNTFQPVAGPKNPDEFNYKRYLWFKEIYANAYLKTSEWQSLNIQESNPVFRLTYQLRDHSVRALQSAIPSAREAGVVEALVIGFRDHMAVDIMQSYTAAGVVHVLAVSGLHVAIVFALLHKLLFFLNRKKHGKLIQSIIIILIIWLFTLVTGLSGSVVRASTMFTFITLGKNMKRPISLFNILSCSAMAILLIDPLLVMDIGFQLSYLAVFGIGTLTNYIDQWLTRENMIVDYLWKMVAMSLAAQLATLPLTTFYFHQFPTYFLLANLVVIPLSGVILHLGIVVITLQFLTPLAGVAGKATAWLTYLMNEFIRRIESLPAAVIHLPSINFIQMLLIGSFFIFISHFFIAAQKKWLHAGLLSLLAVVGLQCVNSCLLTEKKTVTIYCFKGKSAVEFRTRNVAQLFTGDVVLSAKDSVYLLQHWRLNNISPVSASGKNNLAASDFNQYLHHEHSFFQFYDYKLVMVRNSIAPVAASQKIKVDALVISGNPKLSLRDLLKCFEANTIVFDGNNSRYKINKWKEEAEQLGVATHDIITDGAFIQNI